MNHPPDPDLNSNGFDTPEESFPDDAALVNFLQQYQPEVPDSSPDLEDHILHAVLDEVTQSPAAQPPVEQGGWKMARWGIPAAIAATIALFWGGSQIWRTAQQPRPRDGDLEAFVAESWSGAFDPFPEEETDLLTDPWDWWGQGPSTSVIAEAQTMMCKRSRPCQE